MRNGLRRNTQRCTPSCTQKVCLQINPPSRAHLFPRISSLLQILHPSEAITANLSTLSVSAREKAEKDSQKKAAKAATAEAREAEKRATSKVQVKRVERNKRKYVTVISGLENHGLDLKKVAKDLGKKFASGSSVTKTAAGGEEVTVQGDVCEEVVDWVEENFEQIPEDNLEVIDTSKKKAGT